MPQPWTTQSTMSEDIRLQENVVEKGDNAAFKPPILALWSSKEFYELLLAVTKIIALTILSS
ncbi:MAG: hypothetical protein LM601_10345 [Candidatus Verstraetearchaeota archaeon]|nr:hypothetical protein [Candidatus Verstraetearchaeota archaeon]